MYNQTGFEKEFPFSNSLKNEKIDYGDIYIHRWKNSMLLKSSRISLAVHSLIEVIILYALIYIVGTQLGIFELGITEQGDSLKYSYINLILYSITVSAMNVSFSSDFFSSYWLFVLHIFQLSLSLILIVLSISTYIGLENTLSKRDENFYLRVHTKKNRKSLKKPPTIDWNLEVVTALVKGKSSELKQLSAELNLVNNKIKYKKHELKIPVNQFNKLDIVIEIRELEITKIKLIKRYNLLKEDFQYLKKGLKDNISIDSVICEDIFKEVDEYIKSIKSNSRKY